MTAHVSHNSDRLKDAGADQVLVPYAYVDAEAVDNLMGKHSGQMSLNRQISE
ncbi:MAG: hypothetical protein QNK26_07775 [Moritella sp.]|uniref:hypothetical protein n=1 Tax=Moritella sp. TaxID=78556 RepID=UPI0029B92E8E|nr:hypothetical protein [Moritella sp.]MDX2320483.1 hypothetical protein [Moritella sp.]